MKKTVALLLVCVLMSFALISCDSGVEGTYVYDDVELEFLDEKAGNLAGALGDLAGALGDIAGIDLDEYKEELAQEYADVEIILEDGKVKIGAEGEYDVADYEQDGDTIKVISDGKTVMELEKDGSKLVMEYELEGILEAKIFFKKK